MKPLTWIGQRPDAVCAVFKSQLVIQPWQVAVKIAFRFETVYCLLNGTQLALTHDKQLQIATVHTSEHGTLIGLNDPYQTGLDYSEAAKQFRAALEDR